MVDGEVVPPADRGEHGRDDILGDILDALAACADEMVVVLGVAGDIRGHMPIALEAAGHPVLDLLLERAIDGCAPDRRMVHPDPVVELLSGERAFCGRQGFRDKDSLLGTSASARREPRRN